MGQTAISGPPESGEDPRTFLPAELQSTALPDRFFYHTGMWVIRLKEKSEWPFSAIQPKSSKVAPGSRVTTSRVGLPYFDKDYTFDLSV